MALLGKISAVLTANTQDFTRRIGESRRELQDFARQARGIQFNLNTRALDGTLTQLQRFQRTLREIQQLQARNVDAGLPNAARLRDQFRAFEDIGRPLTQVRGQIEGLANSLQSQLYPELGRVQSEFQGLYRAIGEGSTTYEASRQRIDALRTSLIALGRATSAVGDFDRLSRSLNANNSGGAFFQPRALESLQRSLSLRGRAQEVPAAFRSDVFGDLAVQAEESAERVARAAARVARYQLEIATAEREGRPVTSLQLANRGIAQRRLDNETSRQNAINLSFQRELDSAAIQQIVSPGAERQVTTLRERLSGLATELRAINGQQFNGLISGAAAVVEQFNRGTASAKQAKQAVDSLAASLSAANTTRGLQQQTESLLFTPREMARRNIQSQFDSQAAGLAADDPRRRRAAVERDINLTRENLNAEVIPRTQAAAQSARSLGTPEAERQANRILEINRQINAELTRATNLNNNNQSSDAENRLQRIARLLAEQQRVEAAITDQVEVRNTARRQEELFLQASGGSAEQLSQGGRDAASDISVARQFRGQIASGAARIAIQAEIDRVTNSVVALQQQMARVAASDLGLDERAAELDRLDNAVRQSTSGLAEFVAARSGGAYGAQQISTAMQTARNQAGSLSVSGAASAQLALQQGLFAIDDLTSATGGLEYKLRAIGNNITQLGLLLGQSGIIPGLTATTGLFVGLSAVLGGQALLAITRWYNAGVSAEDQTKSLNDSLAKQKSLLESLAQAFESLGNSASTKAFSSQAQQAKKFADEIEAVAKKQKELREARVADLDQEVQRERSLQNSRNRELEGTSSPGRRVALIRQIQESRAREQQAAAAAAARTVSGADVVSSLRAIGERDIRFAARNEDVPSRATQDALARLERQLSTIDQGSSVDAIQSQREALRSEIARLTPLATQGGLSNLFGLLSSPAEADLANLQQLLNGLELPLQKAFDEIAIRIIRSSDVAARGVGIAQQQVADAIKAGTPSALSLQSVLDRLASEISAAEREIANAYKDFEKDGNLDRRNERIDRASGRIQRTRDRRLEAQAQASELEQRRILNPQSSLDFRFDRISSRLSSAGIDGGIVENELRKLQARRAKVESELAARPDSAFVRKRAEKELAAIQEATSKLLSLADSAAGAAAALDRISTQLADAVAKEARSASDQARRDANRTEADFGVGSPSVSGDDYRFSIKRRERLEREARRAEDERRRIEEQNQRDREDFERRAAQGGIDDEMKRLIKQRDEAQAVLDSETASVDEKNAARRDRDRANAEIERRYEDSPEGRAAALRADRADKKAQEQRSLDESILRGREQMLTPAERARREFGQRAFDLRNAMNEARIPAQGRAEQFNRLGLEAMQQTAPMLAGFREERLNAMLQGPSRAALNVADAQTMEGSRELNRLLRGDDPNKDVNLVELQKQSDLLQKVIDAINEQSGQNVVEIRG